MTDTAAATQRPWRVRQHSFDDNKKSSGSVFQMVRDGHAYAVAMCPQYQTAERWNADAALIVQAVNERDQLIADLSSSKAEVERLREALEYIAKEDVPYIKGGAPGEKGYPGHYGHIARAALNKGA